MALNPRLGLQRAFQAPPVARPTGLAQRAPEAMSRATGGAQGTSAGLSSLVSNMQKEVGSLGGKEDLPKLNMKMAQAGEGLGRLFRGESSEGGGQPGMFGGPSFSEQQILSEQDPRTALTAAMDKGVLTAAQSSAQPMASAKADLLNAESPDNTHFYAKNGVIYREVGNGEAEAFASVDDQGELIPIIPSSNDVSDDGTPVYEMGGAMRPDSNEYLNAQATAAGQLIKDPPAAAADPLVAAYEKSLADTMGKEALTTEEANKRAKQVLGIDEKDDVPDWAMPLFAFGMALMSEPGSFGQAVGKAGLKTLPVIAQVKKEKKAERFRVAQIARDLMTTDVATRKGALTNAVSLIFKQKTATRADRAEQRAIDKESRLATSAKAKEALNKRKFKLDQKKQKFAEFNAFQKNLTSLIEAVPETSRLRVALELAGPLSDPKLFGKMTDNPSPQQLNAFGTDLFKAKVEGLAYSGKDTNLLLSVMGYTAPDQNKDFFEKKITVNVPVTNADGTTVNRQMERLVRLNSVEVNDVERGPDGKPIIGPDGKPIIKVYAPGQLQTTLDAGGIPVVNGNADPGWTSTTRVETVNGEQRSFSGRVNGKPFWDEGGRYWKQGSHFTKTVGDEGRSVEKADTFNHIVQRPDGSVSIASGTSTDVAGAIGKIQKGTATEDLRQKTLQVVALSRRYGQLKKAIDSNHQAVLAAYQLPGLQQTVMRVADYFAVVTKQRPEFEGLLDGLDLFKNFGTKKGQQQAFLGGKEIKGRGGLRSYVRGLSKNYVDGLADTKLEGADGTLRTMMPEELSALQGLALMKSSTKSMVFNLAYAIARTNEPGGRLTDRDVANALMMMGVQENGSFRPRELINAMDRNVANSQSEVVDEYISRTLTDPASEDAPKITKASIFGKFKDMPLFEVPKGNIFDPSDRRAGDKYVSLASRIGPPLAQQFQIESKIPGLYSPETGTWNQGAVQKRWQATINLLKRDPQNAELLAQSGNLAAIVKRLRPGGGK